MPAKTRILVADDDAGIRDLLHTHLQSAGHDVHTARSGIEALHRIRELHPDAMLLDINMPELDSFGVLERLRHETTLKPIPTLVLTARHAGDDIKRAFSLRAKDYLTKPFSEAQLIARVARLLRLRSSALPARNLPGS